MGNAFVIVGNAFVIVGAFGNAKLSRNTLPHLIA